MARTKGHIVLLITESRNKDTGQVTSYSVMHCPSVPAARKLLRRSAGLKGAGKIPELHESQVIKLRWGGHFWIEPTLSRTFRGRPRKFGVGGHYDYPPSGYGTAHPRRKANPKRRKLLPDYAKGAQFYCSECRSGTSFDGVPLEFEEEGLPCPGCGTMLPYRRR